MEIVVAGTAIGLMVMKKVAGAGLTVQSTGDIRTTSQLKRRPRTR